MKKTNKFFEKILLLLAFIMLVSAGKAQQKISPSTLKIRSGNEQFSMKEWIDIYSSTDKVGGKNAEGYVYYVTEGGIKLWEPSSSFRKTFWQTLNKFADCQSWTMGGKKFVPSEKMKNLSWEKILNDYCTIEEKIFSKEDISVMAWSHNKDQKSSKMVSSLRDSRTGEKILFFDCSKFEKISGASGQIALRSCGCANELQENCEKGIVQEKEIKTDQKVFVPKPEPTVPEIKKEEQKQQLFYSPPQQPQVVYGGGARNETIWTPPPQPPSEYYGSNNSWIAPALMATMFIAGSFIQPSNQGYYQPQQTQYITEYIPQYIPQGNPVGNGGPVWGNPQTNPTLGNGFPIGGPIQGNGGNPVLGNPYQGNGGFGFVGNPYQGNSGIFGGNPYQGNSGQNNSGFQGNGGGGPNQGFGPR